MTTPPNPLVSLALEIHDALVVVATGGWEAVRLDLEPSGATVKIRKLVTKLGPEGQQPKPELGLEPGAFLGVLGEAVPDVFAAARAQGITWSGHALVLERAPGRSTLRLMEPAEQQAHAVELGPEQLGHLVFSDALLEELARTEAEATRRQDALVADALGHDVWRYDEPTGTLYLMKGELPWRRYKAQALGTWNEQQEAFVWAWADPGMQEGCKTAIKKIRAEAEKTPGFGVLTRPLFPCDHPFAWTLARLAAGKLDARGIYRGETDRGALFLAVLE